jgi:hypothetical protein
MTYQRSTWAEASGVYHDSEGLPCRQSDMHSTRYGWEAWCDYDRQWQGLDTGDAWPLLDALVAIIKELKTDVGELQNLIKSI